MNKLIKFSLLLTTIIFLTACSKDDEPNTNSPNLGNAPENPDQTILLNLVNDIRTNGCRCGSTDMPVVPSLIWNQQLEAVAEEHSQYMNQINELTHTGENMNNAGDRIEASGYALSSGSWAENLAKGYADEPSVFDSWKNSESHCKNMMKAEARELGVGTDGAYWTMVLAGQ